MAEQESSIFNDLLDGGEQLLRDAGAIIKTGLSEKFDSEVRGELNIEQPGHLEGRPGQVAIQPQGQANGVGGDRNLIWTIAAVVGLAAFLITR